ncbi:hypothetical protein CRENBAI_007167 [Crenichthys baileyi]|uniref:Uncharacterized protein n=1 Tax=Crenichthys baileyi TaxID=28760 RepID=A0AAV9RMW2_9TELE
MDNKDSSYLKTSSFRSSSPHFGPSKTHFMTEGTSQRDQAGGMVREFNRGEILAARLSTEAGGAFLAHGLAPDQSSLLLPTPNPVPGPVPEGFMDELSPHPDPVPGFVPEGFIDEPPPHPDPVSGPVPEGFMDEPPPHPDPVSGPVPEGFMDEPPPLPAPILEGSEDKLPPSLVAVPEEFVDELSPLPIPVPEECKDAPFMHAVPRRLRRRSPQPRQGSQQSLHRSPGFQRFPHHPSELHRWYFLVLSPAC